MGQLSVDQMVALAKKSKSTANNPQQLNIDQMVAVAKAYKNQPKQGTPPGKVKGFLIGAVNDIGGGLNQIDMSARDWGSNIINNIFGTDLDTNRYDKLTKEIKKINEQYEEQRRLSGQSGIDGARLLGNVAATFTSPAAIGRTIATTAAKGAATGAGIGGLSFAEDSDQRKNNIILGAVGGAAGNVIGKAVGSAVSRGYNAVKNNTSTSVQDILNESAKHNVRVSVGDVGKNPIIQKAEVLNEQVPIFGTSSFRAAQQKEAKNAATNIVEKLRNKMSDADYKSLSNIKKSASNGDKNAIRIMKVVNEAGEDSGKILQAAAEIKNWRGQRMASSLYDRVGKIAGLSPVLPGKTIQTIDNVIANDSKVVPNKELLNELLNIKNNLADPAINTHFGEMRSARSRLGELVDEWGRQGKSTGDLTKIRSAIDDDISEFALNSGNQNLMSEFKRANSFYQQLQSSKDKSLASAMRSQTPDEIFNQFIKVGKGDRAANFYQNLDPKGQAALRYEMANQALSKATNQSNDVFSPAKFALEFERLYEPYQNIFKGSEKAEMDGFVKLMRHAERAGQYAENPPNGNRLAFGAITVANLPLATKIAAQAALTKALFTTDIGRRILLASRDLPADSPKLANLLKQAQQLTMVSGSNAKQPSNSDKPTPGSTTYGVASTALNPDNAPLIERLTRAGIIGGSNLPNQ